MGTANFLYRDRLFAVSFGCNCCAEAEEAGESYHGCDCSSFYYADLLDNIRSTMTGMETKTKKGITVKFDCYPSSHREWDGQRNFEGRILGRIIANSTFFGIDIQLEKNVIVRSGYYEGANIDHDLSLSSDYSYKQTVSDNDDLKGCIEGIIEEVVYAGVFSEKQGERYHPNITKRINSMETALNDAFEYIATQNATEYEVSARFSNGETWYKPKEVKQAA